MNAYFNTSRISNQEKDDILKQHRTLYDGYRTLQPNVPNEQPLYVQDFAKDKVGATVSNKGVVKPYTNIGINEQMEKSSCNECGGMMKEGECSECGWKGEVGAMEESFDDIEDIDFTFTPKAKKKKSDFDDEELEIEFEPERQKGPQHMKSPYSDLDFYDDPASMEEEVSEDTGKLSDIYNVEDLGDSDFDYVEGGGNDFGTFEKMHHMKKIKSEGMYEDPDNEDDGFEDIEAVDELDEIDFEKGKRYRYHTPSFSDEVEFEMDVPTDGEDMMKFKGRDFHHLLPKKSIEKFIDKEIDEQGYTGGGNAPDMDLSNIKPAYDFVSDGPMAGGDVYPTESEMEEEYEMMESAWDDDELEENDISGVQGIYGDMEPAYDFDSEGPGKAGPYQRSSWSEEETKEQVMSPHEFRKMKRKMDAEKTGEDFDDSELDITDYHRDFYDPKKSSWEEITKMTGEDEFANVDEDIRESLIQQKNRIKEMFQRMNVIK